MLQVDMALPEVWKEEARPVCPWRPIYRVGMLLQLEDFGLTWWSSYLAERKMDAQEGK